MHPTHLMHKNPLHLCTRFVAPFCTKGPCLSQKPSALSVSIGGFCTESHRPSSASILPFLPLAACCQAAQYPRQSVILNTHRDTPPNYRRRLCVVSRFLSTAASSQTGERGSCRVVNCESKTVNRIWSRRRSGAWWCMDLWCVWTAAGCSKNTLIGSNCSWIPAGRR